MSNQACSLCLEPGGYLVCEGPQWRIVRVQDSVFPAYYRLIWGRHVSEFSQLSVHERSLCMSLVVEIELALHRVLSPTKVNLASLGNVVPHLHWHVLARFEQDTHYPHPIWGQAQRTVSPELVQHWSAALPELDQQIAQSCAAISSHAPAPSQR